MKNKNTNIKKRLGRKVYLTSGFNTVSLGSGRKEFNPKNDRPGILQYIEEAGRGAVGNTDNFAHIDESVISNFMASRFVRQGHLGAFAPAVHPSLEFKPSIRVEGACASGGLGLVTSMKNILSGLSEISLTIGAEVQNSVKALYCADILAGASYYEGFRKNGHAYFFPDLFSKRAGEYFKKYGEERSRKAMARWYENAILNARKCPEAQEYHNQDRNLFETGMTPANPKNFLQYLNVFDCSKVSDGGSAILVTSSEGLAKLGKRPEDAIEILGYGHCVANITSIASDISKLETTRRAVSEAYEMAQISANNIGIFECHDCFSITGLMALEAAGFAEAGMAPDFMNGQQRPQQLFVNTSGGLIGFGHYTGGTGIRQAVDIWRQLINEAKTYQVQISKDRPYGLMVSMGGDDKTVVAYVFKRGA